MGLSIVTFVNEQFCVCLSIKKHTWWGDEAIMNTAIYVYWDEVSDKPKGWYSAVVRNHLPDSTTRIEYADNAT